jgi:hypothetical protein
VETEVAPKDNPPKEIDPLATCEALVVFPDALTPLRETEPVKVFELKTVSHA